MDLALADPIDTSPQDARSDALIERIATQANGDVRSWQQAALQARESGQTEQAWALLAAAAQRFPDAAAVRHDLGRLAEADRNWTEAERCWRDFAALSPTVWWGATQIAHMLRHQGRIDAADTLLAEARDRFPNVAAVFFEHARLAETRRDWPEAGTRWIAITERFPQAWEALAGQARVCREQGQPDQARALLIAAAERFPATTGPLHELARLAESLRNWPAAERWWRVAIALDPGPWWSYAGLATALQEQGCLPEAEALLTAQFERLAHEPWPFVEHARLAERSKDWTQAARRWASVISRFPTVWEAYCGQARALRQQGQMADARAILEDAVTRFPSLSTPLHDLAQLAEAEHDWPAAEQRWRESLRRDSGIWWAHTGLANALRQQKQTTEARHLLDATIERFPRERGPAIARARMAETEGNWSDALQQWAQIKTGFPADWDGYQGSIAAALRLRRFADAEIIIVEARQHFPGIELFFIEHARLAESRRDWATADMLWRQAEERFPASLGIRIGHVNAVREAGDLTKTSDLLADAARHFPADVQIDVGQAMLDEAKEDWRAAHQSWRRCIALAPDVESHYVRCATALFNAEDKPQAVEILECGRRTLGDRPVFLRELGGLADRGFDWKEAVRRYRDYLASCPGHHDAFVRLALALTADGRLAEGETLLRDAIDAHPDLPELSVAYARIALRAGSSGGPSYLSRAGAAFERFPDFAECSIVLADALAIARRPDEAEAVLKTARARFPTNGSVAQQLAMLLARQSKWDDAIAVYSAIRTDFPLDAKTMLEYANALVAARRWADAKDIISKSLEMFPNFGAFHVARLDIAIANDELDSATDICKLIDTEFSTSFDIRSSLSERRGQLLGMGLYLPDASAAPAIQSLSGTSVTIKPEDIVSHFESLGGAGMGCEFGLFQRACSAEPLGLLRWTDMQPAALADALETEFQGVGEPDQTVLGALGGDHVEYYAADKRFGMRMHTFIAVRSVPYDKMFAQTCRRLSFLKSKLLDDLHAGNKIFVYKNAMRPLNDAEIERLYQGIRRYGNNTILYVRRETADNPCPRVMSPSPGLLIGHIDRFAWLDDSGTTGGLPRLSWADIIVNAYRIWQAAR